MSSVELQQKAEQILQSGLLAGSARLQTLFQYLLRCSLAGYTPKEFEVAVDGMGQSADFDVTQDSLVRVHMHKLRRKLAEAQTQDDTVLVLPRGEYRFLLQPAVASSAGALPQHKAEPPQNTAVAAGKVSLAATQAADSAAPVSAARVTTPWRAVWAVLLSSQTLLSSQGVASTAFTRKNFTNKDFTSKAWRLLPWLLLLASLLLTEISPDKGGMQTTAPAAGNGFDALLQPFQAQQAPVLLMLGDYYLFAEADAQGQVQRLVRQFDINSPLQLLQSQQTEPELAAAQFDLGLSYLPTSVASALSPLAAALERQQIRYEVVLASSLSPAQLQQRAVIYLGQLSGLGPLQTEWQQQAQLQPHGSFDELQDRHSGQLYRNATPLTPPDTLPEYGYLHRWGVLQDRQAQAAQDRQPGASPYPRLVLAGLRDGGLLALTQFLRRQPAAGFPANGQPAAGLPEQQGQTQEWLLANDRQFWPAALTAR